MVGAAAYHGREVHRTWYGKRLRMGLDLSINTYLCAYTLYITYLTMKTPITTYASALSLLLVALVFTACGPSTSVPAGEPRTALLSRLVSVAPGYSQTSVNTTVFRNNSLVTHDGVQYICYYDPEGYLTLGCRPVDSTEWTLNRTQYQAHVEDAHNVASMMVDGEGIIHIAFDHHGAPLNYCRGVAPGSLELGDKEPMVGTDEDDVTYPEFYRIGDGDLLFAYRSGRSGRGNLVLNRYILSEHRWQRVHDVLIDGQDQRNAYWQLYADPAGTLHLSWVWRETWLVETNHDLCYARSTDGGQTWQHADGTPYELPITADNAEYACLIPQGSELINQTSMTADADGHPYIATYWRDAEDSIPQYRLVWHDGTAWQQTIVGQRTQPFSLAGGGTKLIPIARPRLVTDGRAAYYVFRDAERGSRVSLSYTDQISGGNWQTIDLTTTPVDAWEPSIDNELWKTDGRLHIFVQQTQQGDGEHTVEAEPTMVSVLEVSPVGADQALEALNRANHYWQSTHKAEIKQFWDNAAYHTGNMEAYALTGDTAYLNYSIRWAEHNDYWGARSTDTTEWKYNYGESDDYVLFGDQQTCFQTYIDLYNLEPDDRKIARAREVMEYQMSTPQNDYWWWADGLYMVMPVMVKLYNATGNPQYSEKLYEYLLYADSIMYDAEAGLYFRDGKYVYPKHTSVNGLKDFWARGDGWVLCAMAKTLKELPKTDPHYSYYLNRYLTMAPAVAACQQPEGYWTRSLLDPEHAPGPETSGTAFFTYGLLWGINNGLLDEATYRPTILRAWNYLCTVALRADGKLGYVQPIGERAIPGQTINEESTADFGVGAFLLAASEMTRYLRGW